MFCKFFKVRLCKSVKILKIRVLTTNIKFCVCCIWDQTELNKNGTLKDDDLKGSGHNSHTPMSNAYKLPLNNEVYKFKATEEFTHWTRMFIFLVFFLDQPIVELWDTKLVTVFNLVDCIGIRCGAVDI